MYDNEAAQASGFSYSGTTLNTVDGKLTNTTSFKELSTSRIDYVNCYSRGSLTQVAVARRRHAASCQQTSVKGEWRLHRIDFSVFSRSSASVAAADAGTASYFAELYSVPPTFRVACSLC